MTHQPIPSLHFKPLCNNRIISLMCSAQKPLLVFCGSKRTCMQLCYQYAQIINQNYQAQITSDQVKQIRRQQLLDQLLSKDKLQTMIMVGACIHTSELPQQDR